jgi:hypothetical protein
LISCGGDGARASNPDRATCPLLNSIDEGLL